VASEALARADGLLARVTATADAISSVVAVSPLDRPEDASLAARLLRQIKTLAADADELRKTMKAPHLAAGRAVDERFRGPRRELDRVESMIKARLAEAAEKRERARLAAVQAAQDAVQRHDAEAANAALAELSADVASLDGISERWTWEAVEIDLDALPPEYVIRSVNQTRMSEEIRTANREGRTPKVRGVRFQKRATIAARRA